MMAESIITSSKKQRDATVKEYESALESVGISVDGQAAKVIKATKEECDERVKKVKKTKEKLDEKNYYYFNPEFDKKMM